MQECISIFLFLFLSYFLVCSSQREALVLRLGNCRLALKRAEGVWRAVTLRGREVHVGFCNLLHALSTASTGVDYAAPGTSVKRGEGYF